MALVRTICCAWLVALLLAGCATHAIDASNASAGGMRDAVAPLRVMAFNVRVPVEADGPDRWEQRRDRLVATIRDARPDVIGTQELVKEQADYLSEHLPGYRWFGEGRRGGVSE